MSYVQRIFYTGLAPTPVDTGKGTGYWVGFTGGDTAKVVPPKGEALTIGGSAVTLEGVYTSEGAFVPPAGAMPTDGFMRVLFKELNGLIGAIVKVSGSVTLATGTADISAEFGITSGLTSFRGHNQPRGNYRTADGSFTGYTGDFALGVPAPVLPLRVNVQNEAPLTDLDADSRIYTYTYVNSVGQESAPAPITARAYNVGAGSTVTIIVPKRSSILYHPAVHGYNMVQDYIEITSIRIYRTNTGTSETGYQLIAELPVQDVGQQINDVANADLGPLLITDQWDVPPPMVVGGCRMSNGTYVLITDNVVYFSVPGVPYAYPILYSQTTKERLLHIEAVGTAAVILSEAGPYLVSGASPQSIEVVKLPYYQAPMSLKAVSVFLDLVVFPAQDGLMGVDSSGAIINLTESMYEESQWRNAYDLPNLYSFIYDGTYYAFSNSGTNDAGFAIHLADRQFQPLDEDVVGAANNPESAFYDAAADTVYLSNSTGAGNLRSWNPAGGGGAVAHSWSWSSKEYYIPDRSMGALKLTGLLDASNSVSVSLTIDGVQQTGFSVNSEDVVRLPALRGSKYIVNLSQGIGAPEVHTLQLGVHPSEFI